MLQKFLFLFDFTGWLLKQKQVSFRFDLLLLFELLSGDLLKGFLFCALVLGVHLHLPHIIRQNRKFEVPEGLAEQKHPLPPQIIVIHFFPVDAKYFVVGIVDDVAALQDFELVTTTLEGREPANVVFKTRRYQKFAPTF